MLGVHERRHPAALLRLRNHLQRQRRLARRLGTEDLHDAPAREAADAKRVVDADGAGGDGVDRLDGALLPEAHDRPLAELLLDLADGQVDRFQSFPIKAVVAAFNGHVCSFQRRIRKAPPDRRRGVEGSLGNRVQAQPF